LALPRAAADRYGQLGGYGAIVVAIAVGGVLAAWVTGRSPLPREPGVATYHAALLLGAATLGFGLARGIAAAALLGLAFGVSQQRAQLLWVTSLQRNVPDRLLGRVTAVAEFGSVVFLPVSFAVGGLVVQAAGPEVVLVAAGGTGMLAATVGLAVPAVHRWRPFDGDLAADAAARQVPRSSSLPGGQP
ncbi:MAG TPA: hypothetical protein VIV12_30060, partial [Streptosporangiaceae bacterium]